MEGRPGGGLLPLGETNISYEKRMLEDKPIQWESVCFPFYPVAISCTTEMEAQIFTINVYSEKLHFLLNLLSILNTYF